ncbi:MAG: ABC transporter permease [Christensenellales bacterium]
MKSGARKKVTLKRIVKWTVIIALWLVIWQVIYLVVGKEMLFAAPINVFSRMTELVVTKAFWSATLHSLLRVMEGYLLGVIAGTLLAVVTCSIRLLRSFFYPAISVIKATPVASFIILALVWMSKSMVPTFTAFLMVLPIVWANVSQAILGTNVKLLEMAKVFQLKRSVILKNIYLPSVMPAFMAGCTTGLGLAWKAGIAAEVLSTPQASIGTELYNAKIYIETNDLFAWTLVIILLSITIEKLFVFLMNRGMRSMKLKMGGQNK